MPRLPPPFFAGLNGRPAKQNITIIILQRMWADAATELNMSVLMFRKCGLQAAPLSNPRNLKVPEKSSWRQCLRMGRALGHLTQPRLYHQGEATILNRQIQKLWARWNQITLRFFNQLNGEGDDDEERDGPSGVPKRDRLGTNDTFGQDRRRSWRIAYTFHLFREDIYCKNERTGKKYETCSGPAWKHMHHLKLVRNDFR